VREPGGQTGGSEAPGTLASIPQSQRVTDSAWGVVAADEPAIIRKPNGNGLTSAIVPRR
jgi:hypothetical protein